MEKKKIRLLAIQMESAIGNVDLNIETVRNLLKANLEKYEGADFVFLPELWPVGWDCPSFPEAAETLQDSRAIKMLQEIYLISREGQEENNELLFQMNVNLVCINKNFRPTRIPKDICEKIK